MYLKKVVDKQQRFIDKAILKHSKKYSYEKVVYIDSTTDVVITCHSHGDFTQRPAEHTRGKGCSKCAKMYKYSTDEFIEQANIVHKCRYEYTKTSYTLSNKKVAITCKTHGDFQQTPAMHLSGQGCVKCTKTGYSPGGSGSIYVLTCGDETKVGITSRPIDRRVKDIRRFSKKDFELEFYVRFEDGTIPPKIELSLLKELRSKYETPDLHYNGSTECFLSVDRVSLLASISRLCGQEFLKLNLMKDNL